MMLIARTFDTGALVDFKDQIDAVLVELDGFRLDRGGEAAAALVQLDDPVDVAANLGTGENLPRGEPDFGLDLVVLDALVALEHDAVDDRILANRDGQVAGLGAGDDDIGE